MSRRLKDRVYTPVDLAKVNTGEMGTVYLICFDEPFGHARHYAGWARDFEARMRLHQAGRGSNLLAHVHAAGIGWRLTQHWEGDRNLERRIKNSGSLVRSCPRCVEQPRFASTGMLTVLAGAGINQ